MKYIIYCRRSQDREDKQVLSVESQKRELLSYAQDQCLDVVDVICEDMSAYKRGRPKFKQMMATLEEGEADGILTWHLSRLARNGADGGLIMSLMDEKKIRELRTIEKVYFNNADDKFIMAMHFAMAKKSSDDTSSFVKNNLKTKLEHGEYPGVAAYGYLNIDDNGVIAGKRFDRKKQEMLERLGRGLKRIELDPVEAPLIRRLIDFALTGAYSMPMLQIEAENMGIKGKLSGKKLGKQVIINILLNKFYTGRFYYLGELHQGIHEPLVSEEEFERLDQILKRKSHYKNEKHDYTFSTLIFCECGGVLSGEFQKGTHYYRCGRAKGRDATCINTKHVRQDVLDGQIAEVLEKFIIPQRLLSWGLKYLKIAYEEENAVLGLKESSLQQKLKNQRTKLERLTSKWLSEDNLNGDLVSNDEYKIQKLGLMKEISEIDCQLKDNSGEGDNWLTKCENFFEDIRTLGVRYQGCKLIGKRTLLNAMGAKFFRNGDKVTLELGEPYSYFLDMKSLKSPSELSIIRIKQIKTGTLDPVLYKWLPRLDSNQ